MLLFSQDLIRDEIVDFVALTKTKNVAVRFIEEMPFNGKGQRDMTENWNFNRILEEIKTNVCC